MCGIVGFVGKDKQLDKEKKSLSVLIDGLRQLQYRGYDSAGVAFFENNIVKVYKEIGIESINLLEQNVISKVNSHLGIGHTRWATHGEASIDNCHPHQVGKITLVHNGIIENYSELKQELIHLDYSFKSETDTEVGAALIDYLYHQTNDMNKTLLEFMKRVKGAYALGIINSDDPKKLFAIRNESPLIIGITNDGRNYIASDIIALTSYTNHYIEMKNESFAVIKDNNVSIYNKSGLLADNEIKIYDMGNTEISKNGESTFTLKEIKEQSCVFRRSVEKYQKSGTLKSLPSLAKYKKIKIVACGSAYHAGLIGKYLIEKFAEIPVEVEIASEYRYNKILNVNRKTLVIGISQSGETADTIKALEHAKESDLDTLGIINAAGSSMERIVDYILNTCAGREIGVATTKAYSAQITELAFMALDLGKKLKHIEKEEYQNILEELKTLPIKIDQILNTRDQYLEIAKIIMNKNDVFYLGRGIDYALAMEGSLKLKELSYIHSEAYTAGELKHGTISLIEKDTPVLAIITDPNLASKTISNCKEVMARGANVIPVITDSISNLEFKNNSIVIPTVHPLLQPILTVIPLQLIAYEAAVLRDCNVDKPKNLAKSVTVE